MREIRCIKCGKNLGNIDGYYDIKCPRCGQINTNFFPSVKYAATLTERMSGDVTVEEAKQEILNEITKQGYNVEDITWNIKKAERGGMIVSCVFKITEIKN